MISNVTSVVLLASVTRLADIRLDEVHTGKGRALAAIELLAGLPGDVGVQTVWQVLA